MSGERDSVHFLSVEDILTIHELVVEANEDTEPGVSSPGDVEYAVEHVREGHFGNAPESIHEQAYQIIRLIAANHPFVDGNKRTALMSARIFYALNGLKFDYDREFKAILKEIATDEASVDSDTVLEYLRACTEPLPQEYEATVDLWLSRIEESERLQSQPLGDASESKEQSEPNRYDGPPHSEE